MTITGVVYRLFPEEKHRDFLKRRFWLQELNVKYPQMWELEMWHDDDVSQLKVFKEGDVVACDFLPKGRMYEVAGGDKKVKITLQCTGIKMVYRTSVSSR